MLTVDRCKSMEGMSQQQEDNKQLFVAGTSKDQNALPYAAHAKLLGQLAAEARFDLACGAGSGIAKYVVQGYRSVVTRGKIRFYLPLQSEMERVGEEVGPGYDEIVQTDFDYPMRNLYQIKASHALFILTGGDGTLEEALAALADYNIPVAAVKSSGVAVTALDVLSPLFPDWGNRLTIGVDIRELLSFILHTLSMTDLHGN
jgi:predicted Rossmann-fold nucleotide-binding protein